MRLEDGDMILVRSNESLRLPPGHPIEAISLERGISTLTIRKIIGRIVVSTRPA